MTRSALLPALTVLVACRAEGGSPGSASASGSARPVASLAPTSVTADPLEGSASPPVARPGLVGSWDHFYERNRGGILEFVPVGTELPRSMFRERLSLAADGTATKLCPSPSDDHQSFQGTWKLTGRELEVDVACFGKEHVDRYTVIEATPKSLRLKPVP